MKDPIDVGNVPVTTEAQDPKGKLLEQGKSLVKVETTYQTAVRVQQPRNIEKIRVSVLKEADIAGDDFFYSWIVKTRKGPKTIEGPSIGLAMCLAREWTNSAVDVRVEQEGMTDVFTTAFIDIERGFTVKRVFRQKRTPAPGRYDADRWADMEFQKAQSKAIRNVVAGAMPSWLVKQAIETAKKAQLAQIGREGIAAASDKAEEFLGSYGVSLERIEARVGKKKNLWTAQDILLLRGCANELNDGQARASELFPEIGEEKPTHGKAPEEEPPKTEDAPAGDATDEFAAKSRKNTKNFLEEIKTKDTSRKVSMISKKIEAQKDSFVPEDYQLLMKAVEIQKAAINGEPEAATTGTPATPPAGPDDEQEPPTTEPKEDPIVEDEPPLEDQGGDPMTEETGGQEDLEPSTQNFVLEDADVLDKLSEGEIELLTGQINVHGCTVEEVFEYLSEEENKRVSDWNQIDSPLTVVSAIHTIKKQKEEKGGTDEQF